MLDQANLDHFKQKKWPGIIFLEQLDKLYKLDRFCETN
jgi:hypothetical protein